MGMRRYFLRVQEVAPRTLDPVPPFAQPTGNSLVRDTSRNPELLETQDELKREIMVSPVSCGGSLFTNIYALYQLRETMNQHEQRLLGERATDPGVCFFGGWGRHSLKHYFAQSDSKLSREHLPRKSCADPHGCASNIDALACSSPLFFFVLSVCLSPFDVSLCCGSILRLLWSCLVWSGLQRRYKRRE